MLKETTFSTFFFPAIKYIILDELRQLHNEGDNVKHGVHCKFNLDDGIECMNLSHKIFNRYEINRDRFKLEINMNPTDMNNKLDCHKVASAMLYAMLDIKPIFFNYGSKKNLNSFNENVKYVNYRIAFRVACAVIYQDLLDKYKEKSTEDKKYTSVYEAFKGAGCLMLPQTGEDQDSYIETYSKSLFLMDVKYQTYNYLQISDTMFLLELINVQYYGGDIGELTKTSFGNRINQ